LICIIDYELIETKSMTVTEASEVFETVYNVPMTCNSCCESVTGAIMKNEGVKNVACDLSKQTVSVEASIAPSKIIDAIQGTGRDAIIRGTGKPNSAAVCILEDFNTALKDFKESRDVHGLVRLIKTKPNETFVDLTLTGMKPQNSYYASFRTGGSLLEGALSTGESLYSLPKVDCDDEGRCQQYISIPFGIDNLIGRAVTVSVDPKKVFIDSMVGVIARSAGAWENDKYVCSCTGKNIWQERNDAKERGIN
jgi:copper chaperone for superoxide dismutase